MAGSVKGRFKGRGRQWLPSALVVALQIIGAVLLAVSGVVDGHARVFGQECSTSSLLIAGGAVALLVQGTLVARSRSNQRRLERERPGLIARANLGEAVPLRLMRVELKGLGAKAEYFSNERISLYRAEADGFALVARYSKSPRFDQSLGRELLPLEQGAIGEAWHKGTAYLPNLPNPGQDLEPPTKQWLEAQKRQCRIDSEVATGFVMRSQFYAAFRIASEADDSEGVIVFESTVARSEVPGEAQTKPADQEDLGRFVDEGSIRLVELLKATRVFDRARIRELLPELSRPRQPPVLD